MNDTESSDNCDYKVTSPSKQRKHVAAPITHVMLESNDESSASSDHQNVDDTDKEGCNRAWKEIIGDNDIIHRQNSISRMTGTKECPMCNCKHL
jgi:hypothetical protein